MKLSQLVRRAISAALVGVLIFAQMAMSAYACPIQSGATTAMQSRMLESDSTSPMAMSIDAPSLCAAHCHAEEQTDQTHAVKLPVQFLGAFQWVVIIAPTPTATPVRLLATRYLWASASPPLSVLHCCFRI